MPQAKLTVTLPETLWIGELSREHPDATFRVLAAMPEETTGAGLVEIHHVAIDDLLETFRTFDAVTAADIMHRGDRKALLQFETDTPLLLLAMQESGVPLQTPFDIVDGRISWEITASQERLADLVDQFEMLGIRCEVERIQQHLDTESLLTQSQLQLVETALEQGYYDTPRTCTLVELADHVDMAASTVSETLHRAEERLIKEVMESGTVEESVTS